MEKKTNGISQERAQMATVIVDEFLNSEDFEDVKLYLFEMFTDWLKSEEADCRVQRSSVAYAYGATNRLLGAIEEYRREFLERRGEALIDRGGLLAKGCLKVNEQPESDGHSISQTLPNKKEAKGNSKPEKGIIQGHATQSDEENKEVNYLSKEEMDFLFNK